MLTIVKLLLALPDDLRRVIGCDDITRIVHKQFEPSTKDINHIDLVISDKSSHEWLVNNSNKSTSYAKHFTKNFCWLQSVVVEKGTWYNIYLTSYHTIFFWYPIDFWEELFVKVWHNRFFETVICPDFVASPIIWLSCIGINERLRKSIAASTWLFQFKSKFSNLLLISACLIPSMSRQQIYSHLYSFYKDP